MLAKMDFAVWKPYLTQWNRVPAAHCVNEKHVSPCWMGVLPWSMKVCVNEKHVSPRWMGVLPWLMKAEGISMVNPDGKTITMVQAAP